MSVFLPIVLVFILNGALIFWPNYWLPSARRLQGYPLPCGRWLPRLTDEREAEEELMFINE